MEKLLDCSNDDCKEQIARKAFNHHINDVCDHRIVICPFSKYGCNVSNIKAKDLSKHNETYKIDHISNQFTKITNQVLLFSHRIFIIYSK